jgi:methylmalonyl-CoA mutase
VRAERERNVARRTDPITGTSEFPDLREAAVSVLIAAPETFSHDVAGSTSVPLPSLRLAEPFERLRNRSDLILEQTGARPKVFLANLGPPSAFTARAGFAKNFFEAAGIEALTNDGFASLDDMAADYRASKAKLACLCSSDEVYAVHAVDAARTLKVADCRHIYLAGKSRDLIEPLRQAGVASDIYAGCDALQVLTDALDRASG